MLAESVRLSAQSVCSGTAKQHFLPEMLWLEARPPPLLLLLLLSLQLLVIMIIIIMCNHITYFTDKTEQLVWEFLDVNTLTCA